MRKEEFEKDEWLYPRYDLLFVIRNHEKIVYEPKRCGDYTDANPFPTSYIPRVGEMFTLQRRNNNGEIDGYDNGKLTPLYEVQTLRMKIVEVSQQSFRTVCYLDVKQIGMM
ncbi:MAG: hypothetical protein LUH21_04735 [Clostridiales bacterium]|nr:hypothetical protein [Clostridiales bacterium]